MVEEETVNRGRLDRGRLLVLVPHVKPCSFKVKVKVGSKSVLVNMIEDEKPVDMVWMRNILALSKHQDQTRKEVFPEKEKIQKQVEVGDTACLSSPIEMRCQTFKSDKIAKKAINGMRRLKGGKVGEKRDTFAVNLERGKKKWVGRPRKKPLTFVIRNGKLDLEKRNYFVKGFARISEDSSSSSEVETRNRLFLNSEKVRGESSIRRLQSFTSDGADVDQFSGSELVKRGSLVGGSSMPNGVASIPTNQGP